MTDDWAGAALTGADINDSGFGIAFTLVLDQAKACFTNLIGAQKNSKTLSVLDGFMSM